MDNTIKEISVAKEHYNKGRFQIAFVMFENLLEKEITNPEVYYYLGCLYYRKGKISPAIKHFKRAIDLKPSYTDASLALSMTLNDSGRYQEATEVFERGERFSQSPDEQEIQSEIDIDIALKHEELGNLYFRTKKYDEAIEQFLEAYKYSGKKIDIRLRIIDCYLAQQQYTLAETKLQKIIKYNPKHFDAMIKLGLIYFKTDRIPEAIEKWENVIELDPDNKKAIEMLSVARSNTNSLFT